MSTASITTLFSSWDVDMISSTSLLLLSFPHLARTISFTSWTQLISYYALLMVSISVGRNMKYLSRSVYYFITSENVLMESNYRSEQITIVYSLLMLGVCFLILGITNRYSWILLCYGVIANTSATLQCVADSHLSMQNSSLSASMGIGNDFSNHLHQDEATSMDKLMIGSYQRSNRYNAAVSFESAKRTIIVFIFTALLCVLFFDESSAGAYPLQAPGATHCFILLSIMCIATALNRISQSDYICHRRNSVVGRCIGGCKALLRSLVYYALYKVVGHRMATYVSSALEANEEKYIEMDGADPNTTTGLSNDHPGHGHHGDKGKGGRDGVHTGATLQKKPDGNNIGNLTGNIETNGVRHEGRLPQFFASAFKDAYSDDDGQARIAFFKTLTWRQMHRIDDIFTMPQAKFYQILKYFPHAIHGKSLDGCVVVYEKLGSSNPVKLRELGISPEMLVYHFIMRNEFVLRRIYERNIEDINTTKGGGVAKSKSNSLLEHGIPSSAMKEGEEVLEDEDEEGNGPSRKIALEEVYPASEMAHLISVLDVKGISMGDVTSDVLSFLRQSGEIMDMHYPGVVRRLIIVNAPTWFWTIWSMISRVFSESIRQKISIVGDCKSLDEHIDPAQRPEEFGGTDVPLGESPEHKVFMDIAQQWVDSGEYVMYAADGSVLSAGRDDVGDTEGFASVEDGHNTNYEGNNDTPRDEEGNDGDSYISDDSFSAAYTSRNVQKRGKGRKVKRKSRRRPDYYDGSSSDSSSTGSSSTSSDSDTSRDTLLEDDTQGKDKGGSATGAVGGFLSWMSSRFKQTPQAYMGEKNGYEFDEESGLWRIRFDAEDSSRDENDNQRKRSNLRSLGGGRSGDLPLEKLPGERLSGMRSPTEKMTKEQLEEHGLVLAIQAAHLAARMKKGNNIIGNEFGVDISRSTTGGSTGKTLASSSSDSLQKEYQEERDFNLSTTPSKTKQHSFTNVSANPNNTIAALCKSCFCCISVLFNMFKILQQHEQILVLTGVMYFATCATLAGLLTMVPVWCLSPKEFGGKGYGVVEMGLVMSTAALFVLQYHLNFRYMARQQAQISPLKGIRISALILVVSLMLMPYIGAEGYLSPLYGHEYWSPTSTCLALPLPGFLIACTICSAHYLRQGTECLLYVALRSLNITGNTSSYYNYLIKDKQLMPLLGALGDAFGPVFAGVTMTISRPLDLEAPMDATFLFSFSACVIFGLFMVTTVFLSLRFRGDFGVVSENLEYQLFRN